MARCDSYAPGNCTAGACEENPWIPGGLGDGGDWAADAAAMGFQVTGVPTVGSVVCYCRGDGYSEFGHVASVVAVGAGGSSFEVHEENFIGFAEWDYRWSGMGDVCGFILAPGMAPGQPPPPGQGGPPPGLVLPWQPVAAWDNVRTWTRDLGAETYGRALTVINLADQLGR